MKNYQIDLQVEWKTWICDCFACANWIGACYLNKPVSFHLLLQLFNNNYDSKYYTVHSMICSIERRNAIIFVSMNSMVLKYITQLRDSIINGNLTTYSSNYKHSLCLNRLNYFWSFTCRYGFSHHSYSVFCVCMLSTGTDSLKLEIDMVML